MTRTLTSDDLYALKLAEDPQIAPDGQRVAYVVVGIDRPTFEYRRAIWVAPASGGEARAFTSGPNDSSPLILRSRIPIGLSPDSGSRFRARQSQTGDDGNRAAAVAAWLRDHRV